MIGVLRVSVRLLLLAAITSWTVGHLSLRRRLAGSAGTNPGTDVAIGRRWSRRVLRLLGVEPEVHGTPPTGVVMLLANHRSYIDIPILLAHVPCAFLAKAEIGDWPLFGRAAKLQHTVFVQREVKESRQASRAASAARLRAGLPFAAFPEGTTTRGPGTLPFFRGLFEVAHEESVPVVPVAISYETRQDAWVGDDDFLSHFLGCFRRSRVRVRVAFGPPVRGEDATQLLQATSLWISDRLERLDDERPAEQAPIAHLRPAPAR